MIAENILSQQHDGGAPSRHSRAADLHTPVLSGTTPADDAARQQRGPQPIVIRTIVCDPRGTGFYISPDVWRDPVYVVRERLHTDRWHWIGERGWYYDARNEAIFEYLHEQVDLHGWHDGMFDLFEVTLPAELAWFRLAEVR